MGKLRVLSLFSGIGGAEKALKELGIGYELLGYSEVDKYAIQSYCELHNETPENNFGDIKRISKRELSNLGEVDLLFHGSPCQSFSVANTTGEVVGGEKGSGTQSSLMWETVRIVKSVLPKVVVWENVKAVYNKSNINVFNQYLDTLVELGYTNYHSLLIGSDFGVPQKRERMFCVSIKGEHNPYKFPSPKDNAKVLRDILEDKVDDKYIVPTRMIENWYKKKPPFGDRFTLLTYDDIGFTLTAKGGREVITNNYVLVDESDYIKITEYKGKSAIKQIIDNNIPLRSLTPKEYWRMQGWNDESIDRIVKMGISDAQMYRQAGNSIAIPVLVELFRELFDIID